ncbi:MAG: hypothetical protein IT580_02495 [Verrucomicrobiales bacterium]|nr:hypothetical protein [Verrucomicrobiales bacterium]
MFRVVKNRWVRLIAALGALVVVPISSPAQSLSCFAAMERTVCKCTSCTYMVLCKFQLGVPSTYLGYDFCTGNNPGFVVMSAGPANSGRTSQSATYGIGCGTATLVGACCGGTRAAATDASVYTIMSPSGTVCGAAGTAGTGV